MDRDLRRVSSNPRTGATKRKNLVIPLFFVKVVKGMCDSVHVLRTLGLFVSSLVSLLPRRDTDEERGGGHQVFTRRLELSCIVLPPPLAPPPGCYLSPPQPRPGPPVTPGTPAPADKEGRRETGRTPEGNRCLRYPGFTYRGREAAGEGGRRVRQRGFRERKINISPDFFLLF